MTTTMSASMVPVGEQRLVLERIDWDHYIAIADVLPVGHGLRLIYNSGRLTLLTTSRQHDWYVECLTHLVVMIANVCGISWEPAGQATFRLKAVGGGIGGDRTYYFGANAERMRGPQNIDLTTQPAPDLAIEVELSHPADDAMAVWGRLGVPEVWRFDAGRLSVNFWLRLEDGTYSSSERSKNLPLLESMDVLEQLRLADELGTGQWYAQLDGWVREKLLPRRGDGA